MKLLAALALIVVAAASAVAIYTFGYRASSEGCWTQSRGPGGKVDYVCGNGAHFDFHGWLKHKVGAHAYRKCALKEFSITTGRTVWECPD